MNAWATAILRLAGGVVGATVYVSAALTEFGMVGPVLDTGSRRAW